MIALLLLGLAATSAVSAAPLIAEDCPSDLCGTNAVGARLFKSTAPRMQAAGDKTYWLAIFSKMNWYSAALFCRYQGMQLASINSQEEQIAIKNLVSESGFSDEFFWTSGFDLAKQGTYSWLATGLPIKKYTNWGANQPDNAKSSSGEIEHCVHLRELSGNIGDWNDYPCSYEMFFVCEK